MTIMANNLRHLDEIRSNMVQDDKPRQSMSRIPEESKVALDDSNSFIKLKMIKISRELTITAPTVSVNTVYSLYINSAITGYTNPFQKIIILPKINWCLQNCEECDTFNSSICSKCSSGYVFSLGSCISLSSSSSSSTSSTTNSNSPVSSGKSDPNMASSPKNSTDTAKALKTTTQCIAGATAVLVAASNIMNTSSMANLWLTINQVQMYFLLLLTKAFIPDDVQTTIVGSKLALNMPNYIPVTKIRVYESLIGNFYFELSDIQLDLLGIPSDSTIYNAAPFILMLLLTTLLHTFLFVLNKLLLGTTSEGKCSCLVKIAKCIILKFFMVLIYGYYIRSMLEMTQFLVISSVYEIYQFNTSETLRVASIIFSFVVSAFLIALFSFMLYLSLSSYKLNEDSHSMLEEFFSGLKMEKKFRINSSISFGRRALYVVILIVFMSYSSKLLINALSVLQLIYIVYAIFLRSYVEIKCNIIDILNEIYFFFLLGSLVFWNTESNWNSIKISVYMWVLCSNSLIIFLIVIIDSIRLISIWIWKKCSKSTENDNKIIKITPKMAMRAKNWRHHADIRSKMASGDGSQQSVNQIREESKAGFEEDNSNIQIKRLKDWE